MRFSTLIEVKDLFKAYTEGIYADTPNNRKLGRVGMSYQEYKNKIRNDYNTEEDKWSSIIKSKEDRKLASQAAKLI